MNKNTKTYYSQIRSDVFNMICDGQNKILEIGCGQGKTLQLLKKIKKASFTVGIDKHYPSIKYAQNIIDKAICCDVEKENIKLEKNSFDYILCLDIIEHLHDPQIFLTNLKSLLKLSGILIVSIPNIRNIQILKNLIVKDSWKYEDKGILDRTHIRFFTKTSFVQLTDNCGYEMIKYKFNSPELNRPTRLLDLISGHRLAPFYIVQHLFKFKLKS
ncbi:hypothetical protein COX08_02315 [Candidatus Beckwithbacteria bacterium CG23_combo_of_CG06-09_8_20_14_all_34_8]|uniref:Methyltransferase domain-containing protein n=1 Tax=Candidatus Beckwithbacteria bacterium CG23_combo_of_CG06-09_8_20_14_all_34_8 TaxID=1974497 RepID=A0A2H0B6F7_9BACT|nr:MAG: hypothetical protein COX08_02315 [Candidatus Beckwithbacteria bacterium CG23_combo_of_CG06-09_8_20_14_all_34_8]